MQIQFDPELGMRRFTAILNSLAKNPLKVSYEHHKAAFSPLLALVPYERRTLFDDQGKPISHDFVPNRISDSYPRLYEPRLRYVQEGSEVQEILGSFLIEYDVLTEENIVIPRFRVPPNIIPLVLNQIGLRLEVLLEQGFDTDVFIPPVPSEMLPLAGANQYAIQQKATPQFIAELKKLENTIDITYMSELFHR